MTASSPTLKYDLPRNKEQAAKKLASILNIPAHKVVGDADQIVRAMTGTILYRQLNRLDRISAMSHIRKLSHLPLQNELTTKCLDSGINHQWAVWSMTNEELASALQMHNEFNRWSSLLGGNPGAYGVGGSVWSIVKQGASNGNIAVLTASLMLMGIHEFSYNETQKYSNELENRKVLR